MKNILIIEDDVVFSRSISNWLKKKGMATGHVSTLSAARKELQVKKFDLVLADLRLPDGSQVVLRSIRYAASDGHRVTLHCKDGDRTLRTSFAAVEPLLCAYPCFCGICRGVVVNFHEVAGRQEDVFLLKDGTRLPISRRRLREVQEAYSAFRFDRLRKDGVD